MKRSLQRSIAPLLIWLSGCSQSHESPPSAVSEQPLTAAAAKVPVDVRENAEQAPARFSNAQETFATLRDTLLREYYQAGLKEDDLYRAAAQGMLEGIDPTRKKWNVLLSPSDAAVLRADVKGELVGIGTQIRFDEETGYADVLGVIAGTPAERAGIVMGDKIVSINGKLYKGMKLADMVLDLRGKVNDVVTVAVLRGDKVVPHVIKRELVSYESVAHVLLPDSVGYVQIRSFSGKTVPMLRAALEDLLAMKARGLVVDLRDNHGGLFDEAVGSAELLLADKTPIVTLKRRDRDELRVSKNSKPMLLDVPMAVLVERETSSGAELLAAALQEGRRASLVGGRTLGKWSVQTVKDLDNGYAAKFTVALFMSPSGRNFDGIGMLPEVEVTMDEKQLARAYPILDPDKRLAADPQLRAAAAIVKIRN